MKKKFGRLSKPQQAKIEAEYHRMQPDDLDKVMSRATRQTPTAVRLPHRLVEDLRRFAEQQGRSDFRKMVKSWIEERLRQETNTTR